jgi:hypothetical protein
MWMTARRRMDLDCDPLTAHAPSVVTRVQHCIVVHRSCSNLSSSSPAIFSGRLLLPLLMVLLKGFFGGQNGPRPRPIRHIKCPTAQLFRPCAGGAIFLMVIVVHRRRGFLFAVHRRRVGAMALRRRARQRIEPATTAAATATPYPLVLYVKLLSELAKNVIYLIVNGCGGLGGRPAGLFNNRRPDLFLFFISGFIIVVILVLGQMTAAEVASAPPGGGLGFGGGQEAVVEFAYDPIEDVQTASYVIAETQREEIM